MSSKPMPHPELVPSVDQYVAGFKEIGPMLNDEQLEMLRNHHDAPARVMTATELAHSVGFADYRGFNSQYGRLGKMLGEVMGIPYWTISLLATGVKPGAQKNEHCLIVMRENVALALEQLGWAKKTSRLFFPNGTPSIPSSVKGEEVPAG